MPSQVLSCQGTGTTQGRWSGREGLSFPLPTSPQICSDLQQKKQEKKERSSKTTLEGKFQLPDLGTTSPCMLTERQTGEKKMKLPQNEKRKKKQSRKKKIC